MSSELSQQIITAIRNTIGDVKASLHEPTFGQSDHEAMREVIDCGLVSSVGPHLDRFEEKLAEYTGAEYAVAVVNGTAAITLGLLACGVKPKEEVLIPALTFVATGNAVLQMGAAPHFVESDAHNFGIDARKLEIYLKANTEMRSGRCVNVQTKRIISAIIPVHIFGQIGDISKIMCIAKRFNLRVIEDAAEALGSFKNYSHAGCFGDCGAISFNGNKIITTGGGGAVITNNFELATYVRHIASTAKIPHEYEYFHDRLGFNFRMPSLNAALGCSQLEKIGSYLRTKAQLNQDYSKNFSEIMGCDFVVQATGSNTNHWLNTIKLKPEFASYRNNILDALNANGIGSRPIWTPLNQLPHFQNYPTMDLSIAEKLAASLINIPSSPFLARSI